MKLLISIFLLLNLLRFRYVYYENTIKDNNIRDTIKNEYFFELEIPKINLYKGIYNIGSKENNVDKNIELLKPCIMPNKNNSIILLASHNGNSKVSYFRNLYKLNLNDKVIIKYNQKKYVYQIVNIYDINKTGKAIIKRHNYNNILVLITCKGNNKQTVFISSLIS